jgi:aspartate/methionine/tyrosine aminotransferase
MIRRPESFLLEDFHAIYEHRTDLMNLATSDARYWKLEEVSRKCESAKKALDALELSYPDVSSLGQVLEPFSNRVTNGVVVPTSGAGEAIFLALAGLGFRLGGSLSVAVPRPAFGAFEGLVLALGHRVEPYYYRPQKAWSLDDQRLLDCARTCDVVMVNSPHNPTGAIIDPELLQAVGATLRERGRYLVSDEVFLMPEDAAFQTPLGSNAIAIGSLSKMFGMPGLRLGWLVAPPELSAPLKTLQQYTTLSLNAFAVCLGAAVLPRLTGFGHAAHLAQNRRLLKDWAQQNSSSLRLSACEAGTTAVLEVETSDPEAVVFDKLLEQRVLLAPGSCFGVTGPKPWFRLGYGRETKILEDALGIVGSVLQGRS